MHSIQWSPTLNPLSDVKKAGNCNVSPTVATVTPHVSYRKIMFLEYNFIEAKDL